MRKSKFKPFTIPSLQVDTAGSEGKCISRFEDKVYMIDFAVPGDVIDAKVYGTKRKFGFASIEKLIVPSPDRVDTFCDHFGMCGGCKWQQMSYEAQLRYKQQQVTDAFDRIGKLTYTGLTPIIGSEKQQFYRNKLEYSFTHRKWLTTLDDKENLSEEEHAGLGYHIPGRFDKVFDVSKCWLMDDTQNRIRNRIKLFCTENGYSFFDLYKQEGFMRGIILRNTVKGEWMLIVSFGYEDAPKREALLSMLHTEFPEITSLLYVINDKRNDTINDLDIRVHAGNDHLVEFLGDLKFKIGPQSFFQTNTYQTLNLYEQAKTFAGLTGKEVVYDLYTGVGTIALFVASGASKVVGIEYVEGAIVDAHENARLNGISHAHFFAGDMKDVLNDAFVAEHGKPDVIITDPPRAGMHEDVVKKILELTPQRIVYVSCNAATQARDLALMETHYAITRVQPVDMFPHTHHVENIVLLELRS